MLRRLLLYSSIQAPLAFSSAVAIERTQILVETSPDATLLGNLMLRAETESAKNWRLELQIGHSTNENTTKGSQTVINEIQGGMRFYPDLFSTHGPFFGVGTGIARSTSALHRIRPSLTYFKPGDGSNYDQWTTNVTSWNLNQSLGYRLLFAKAVTVSCGVTAAEILHSSTTFNDLEMLPGATPDKPKQQPMGTEFFLNLGIYFQ